MLCNTLTLSSWYENSRQGPARTTVMKLKTGFETNEIRQLTEGICLKEQGRAEKGGQTNQPSKTAVNKKQGWWMER